MLFVRLLSRLPLPLLYSFADILFVIGFYVVRYRRKLIRKNIQRSFPEKSTMERYAIERKFFRNLCNYAVEMLKLITMSEDELKRRMIFTNPEVIQKFKDAGQSVIYLASHQFNWEWLLAAGCTSLPLAVDFIYQPVNNKFFDRLSLSTRARFGGYPVKRNDVARAAIQRSKILRGIALVGDQYPGYRKDKKYLTTFLNQETAFFYGINQLAILTQYPALFLSVKKVKRGYYQATIREVARPPYEKNSVEVIENYKDEVERLIHENPEEWLWSHDRWKTRHLKYPENLIYAQSKA